jgi:GNAT superfamily N-acetyltransferase
MKSSSRGTAVAFRTYHDDDQDAVLELLRASLGTGPIGHRPADFFRWKHLESPFGRSFMLVAEVDDRIVGLRAFMRWLFRVRNRAFSAVRAVDTATHPDYQGMGIFSRLTLAALDALRGDVGFVFNTPNEKSGPGYLKMGWSPVGQMPVWIHVRRPVRFAKRASSLRTGRMANHPTAAPGASAPLAADILSEFDSVDELLRRTGSEDDRFATDRSARYLRWRYGDAPHLDYRAVRYPLEGPLQGLAIFRVHARGKLWESTVADIVVPAGDQETVRRLLAAVGQAARTDYLACRFPTGHPPGVVRGWIKAPGGITFMVNRLRDDLAPDPADARSWALSIGDLEVF